MSKLPITDFIKRLVDAGANVQTIIVAVREIEMGQSAVTVGHLKGVTTPVTTLVTKRTGHEAGYDVGQNDEKRKKARERKQKQRATKVGQASVTTQNVTMSQRDIENSAPLMVENTSKDVLKLDKKDKKERSVGIARGFRLPQDFAPNAACEALAREMKLTRAQWNTALADFRDYWDGVPGSRGTKLDWHGTFRNSLRRRRQTQNGYQSAKQQHANAAQSALDEQYKFITGSGAENSSDGGLQDSPVINLTDNGDGSFSE